MLIVTKIPGSLDDMLLSERKGKDAVYTAMINSELVLK
jgi:hypothetical protein